MAYAISSPIAAGPAPSDLISIPVREVLPWLLLGTLLALSVLVLISSAQGAITIPEGTAIHEWVHDGRHLLGFPCH